MLGRAIGVVKDVARIGEVKDARIVMAGGAGKDVMVEVTWSARNLSTKDRTYTTQNYFLREGGSSTITSPPITLDKNVLLRRISASGKLTACVVGGGGGKKEGKASNEGEHITITAQNGFTNTYDLFAADKHGKVYADGEFSCLEFSSDDTKLVYIAEKRRGKAKSFLDPAPKSGEDDTRGKEYDYYNTWGEQLEDKSESVVCILDLTSGQISTHPLPNSLCAAQCSFVPRGGQEWAVVGVGFVSRPYRLGLIFCHNRESHLFHLDSHGNFEVLGSVGYNIRSPRWSPDGTHLAYLRAQVGGPHNKVSQLCVLEWPGKEDRVLIDVVERGREIRGGPTFRGINGESSLPRRCWDADSSSIVFSSIALHSVSTFSVSVQTGEMSGMGENARSQRVWDVCGGLMLVEESSMCKPSQFILTTLLTPSTPATKIQQVTTAVESSCFPENYFTHWLLTNPTPHPDSQYSDIPIPTLYFGPPSVPQGTPKLPLLVCPHGGPHSAFTNTFSVQLAFYVRLGFCVLMPNYRGSLGVGEDGVNSLPGHCGVTDVSDVYLATLDCIKRFSDVIDEDQIFLIGGSHGGFLVTHLAAQHPDTYKAVVSRNPVTDISAMAGVSDIPDWCFVETGQDYQFGLVPDANTLGRMLAASPISRLDTLKAPILFLVGSEDQRCPPSQALNIYKMLLARGVETQLQLYPDNHSLRKVAVEVDTLIQGALWFTSHGASLPPTS